MKTEAKFNEARCTETHLLKIFEAVSRERLLDTALRLLGKPSRTGEAADAADELEAVLSADGFLVQRSTAGYPAAPAVAVRYSSGSPGRTLQFNGHLDTVHLPFVPPQVVGDRLTGSGAADMKAGIAAAVEALRAVRDAGALAGGDILLTAHDMHEAPWGDGRQLDALIAERFVGDAVLIPEYFNELLPIIGRGGFSWTAQIRRPGPPVHEVLRPNEPSVIAAGVKLASRLEQLNTALSSKLHPMAGSESMFIGSIQSGAIYNEYPQTCRIEGTRRWLPGTRFVDANREFRELCREIADTTGTSIDVETRLMRDSFELDPQDPFVAIFQSAYRTTTGEMLPFGGKPFVDDGNSFWSSAGIPAITHGPTAGGAHTTSEWVNIDDLVRVARLYALIATIYCPPTN
jgi:acetylornithine deacetylase/succinyl-diaminopimelate desuccinylase-like protein